MARSASEMFSGGNFLKKEDIRRPTVLHVGDVRMKTIGDDGKKKPVIVWEEDRKPMVCNVGNWDVLKDYLGDDLDGWEGESIEVFVDPNVKFGNERVGGLRLRPPEDDDDQPRGRRSSSAKNDGDGGAEKERPRKPKRRSPRKRKVEDVEDEELD